MSQKKVTKGREPKVHVGPSSPTNKAHTAVAIKDYFSGLNALSESVWVYDLTHERGVGRVD